MTLRRAALLGSLSLTALAANACGSDGPTGTQSIQNTITAAERTELADKVAALGQRLANTNSAGAEVSTALSYAYFALIAGAPVGTVTGPADATYRVMTVEIAQTGAQPFKVLVALQDTVDIAFARYSGTGNIAFSPTTASAGFIWRTPNSLWRATTGSVNVARVSTVNDCQNFAPQAGNPTTCRTATFNAALAITASEPVSGTAATGAPTFSLPTARVGGLYVTQ